jgi:hypothetical protein
MALEGSDWLMDIIESIGDVPMDVFQGLPSNPVPLCLTSWENQKKSAIHFAKCTSASCSKAPPQHDADTPVLHGWNGVLRLESQPLFLPNITMVIMAKQFYFCFIRPEDISPKIRSLSPCAVANCSLAFFMVVLEQWLLPC